MEYINLQSEDPEYAVQKAGAVLRAGGLIIYPTETLYGAGVDAKNPEAVDKLLQFKKRPAGKAISVLVTSIEDAEEIVEIKRESREIMETLLPGPVTVICKEKYNLDPRLASEFHTLGIRISSHPIASLIAEEFGRPLTATSANSAGAPRPYSIQRMLDHLSLEQKNLIDLVLDAGELPKREPSTVIDTTSGVQTVIRAGGAVEQLAPPFISASEEETKAHAATLLSSFKHVVSEKALVFALEGEMGMGKTRFAQGLGAALGVEKIVSSPSFTLIKEYPAPNARFIHMDLWRTEEVTPDEIGMDEYLVPGTVVAIEWPRPVLRYLQERQDSVLVQRLIFEELPSGKRSIMLAAL